MAWTADGERLATGSSDATARVWEARTGRLLLTLEGHKDILVNGTNFWPEQYYRDDDQARRALLACGQNPVLVTGLRRIGKSWFLRRLEQIFRAGATRHFIHDGSPIEQPIEPGMSGSVALLDAGSEDFQEELGRALAAGNPRVVLAIDEMEKLADDEARIRLIDVMLASRRPLILAAAPSIHEIARRRAPALADSFEKQCVPLILGPLLGFERLALMLQSCDPGRGLQAMIEDPALGKKLEGLALGREWGGHTLVLQQVGETLQRNPKIKFPELVNLVHVVLNGAPRYGYSLCETGLTSDQRQVLLRVAAGDPPASDDHTALELQAHGAIVLRKGKGWALENVVLQRYFDGLAKEPAGGGSLLKAPKAPVAPTNPKAPTRVFTWIHLSDLHFGAGNRERHFDRKRVTQAIARDVHAVRTRTALMVDRIFVTGDIAYSARREEYEEAKAWFDEVSRAVGVPLGQLRLVPGNHDVDRGLAKKPLASAVHRAVRQGLVDLDDLLADADAHLVLAAKLGGYRSFVDGAFFGHPRPLDNGIDWVEVIPERAGARGPLRIAGLSTVWISDDEDGNRKAPFIPNMTLARGPLAGAFHAAEDCELILVLTHHPPYWLDVAGAQALGSALARPAHVHLCGHVHGAAATAEKHLGRGGRSVRWVAGASHGDKGEEYGYAWGALRHDPVTGQWQAGWAPRTFEPTRDEMRADSMRYDLDTDGFAWEHIDCPWPAPTESA